ncbi:RNA-binding protein 8A-like [Schistocerca gregaria]|uniref:RNA-binding protein 8A-like n=1 Tax=Schistocerca gregaria TaxID=7010 RepID=UPI00211EF2FF|nr:RNA-binding protein 8A-like [Schistocerca gregaria]
MHAEPISETEDGMKISPEYEDEPYSPESAPHAKSIEGWIVLITNIHEEATDADLLDKLADFGPVTNLQMPLDRRTGYVKGYALAEYREEEQAKQAIQKLNGAMFMDREISVSWAIADRPRAT